MAMFDNYQTRDKFKKDLEHEIKTLLLGRGVYYDLEEYVREFCSDYGFDGPFTDHMVNFFKAMGGSVNFYARLATSDVDDNMQIDRVSVSIARGVVDILIPWEFEHEKRNRILSNYNDALDVVRKEYPEMIEEYAEKGRLDRVKIDATVKDEVDELVENAKKNGWDVLD